MKRTGLILTLIGALIGGTGCGAIVGTAINAAAAEQARKAAAVEARNACYKTCADAGGGEAAVNACRAGCDERIPTS